MYVIEEATDVQARGRIPTLAAMLTKLKVGQVMRIPIADYQGASGENAVRMAAQQAGKQIGLLLTVRMRRADGEFLVVARARD